MDSFCESWGAFGIPCFMVGTYKIYNTWHSGIGGTADGFRSSLPPGFEKKKRDVVHRERKQKKPVTTRIESRPRIETRTSKHAACR